jgi:hypothetical protein
MKLRVNVHVNVSRAVPYVAGCFTKVVDWVGKPPTQGEPVSCQITLPCRLSASAARVTRTLTPDTVSLGFVDFDDEATVLQQCQAWTDAGWSLQLDQLVATSARIVTKLVDLVEKPPKTQEKLPALTTFNVELPLCIELAEGTRIDVGRFVRESTASLPCRGDSVWFATDAHWGSRAVFSTVRQLEGIPPYVVVLERMVILINDVVAARDELCDAGWSFLASKHITQQFGVIADILGEV